MLATTITLMILVTSAYPDRQEILANAKVRARQQCVYELKAPTEEIYSKSITYNFLLIVNSHHGRTT